VSSPEPGRPRSRNPRLGYTCAVLAAIISGVSIYVNSFGVKLFHDATLYTMLKNSVVGLLLLLPLIFMARRRMEYARLNRRQSAWLVALALTGGSIPYVLFFHGLQLTNAITGSVLNHLQFAFVALIAFVFLRERISAWMWAGLAVLLAGTLLGTNLGRVHWDTGAYLVMASTLLFAIDFVIAKHLLQGLSTLAVMAAKMTLGSALLVVYSGLTGHLAGVARLTAHQVELVLLTGLILLAFTCLTFLAIRHAMVSAVMAIGMASPIVTTALQLAVNQHLTVAPADLAGIVVTVLAVAAILVLGIRQEAPGRGPAAMVPA